ncbi:hypothetical protein CGCSCA5_v009663 [Colletotrichum siamense]|uniref:uncharacterized protein n=1 Tax=Colletotrichum aenigma TaxID=1215731 RepID=UPI001872C325|nr:uncharacterized protein CGCA056_v014377 [Colletotrichum aenigma]KAF4811803.1 hypothetical protein CGCSCA5_v009663 [Colletotrichum siamense]KAF4867968.1 hypothetical protein CGCSCA1_v012888 [Colletotrichum siamense]KAF5502091.1 hypothetical protein CGCA056_v014377 [Colletotrichum aenigma]
MRFSLIAVLPFLVSAVVAQRGIGGECRNDADCIRCLNNKTPLICKTDSTSTTGKRCGAVDPPCRPF